VQVTNRSAGTIPALIVVGVLAYLLIDTALETPWVKAKQMVYEATAAKIGDLFLYTYLLPFELASLVLLAAMIGAVVLSRKEIKE
jgi:NADH-quinone oxidoreductase subunit J